MMRVLAGSFCGTQILKRQVAGLHIVETSYAPDESVPWHVHRWPYVTFVLRGGYSEDCGRRTSCCTRPAKRTRIASMPRATC
jgi:hypothetical protein